MEKVLFDHNIETRDEALIYMVECTLATVEDLAGRARPPRGELRRQIAIAQTGINALKGHVVPGAFCGAGRVQDVFDEGVTVEKWAGQEAAESPQPT